MSIEGHQILFILNFISAKEIRIAMYQLSNSTGGEVYFKKWSGHGLQEKKESVTKI